MFIDKKTFFIIFVSLLLNQNIYGASKITGSLEAENAHKKELGQLLLEAIGEKDTKKALDLIAKGADVNAINEYSDTALMLAIESKNLDLSKALIDAGADINAVDSINQSVLLRAIDSGINFVKLLLDNGRLNRRIINLFSFNSGTNPLVSAVILNNNDLVKLLIASGANVNAQSPNSGMTPLMHACRNAFAKIAKLLIDAGADTDIKNELGQTALMYAATTGNEETVKLLLNANADPNIKDKKEKIAKDYALAYLHTNIAKMIEEEKSGKRIQRITEKISDSTNIPTDPAKIIAEYIISQDS